MGGSRRRIASGDTLSTKVMKVSLEKGRNSECHTKIRPMFDSRTAAAAPPSASRWRAAGNAVGARRPQREVPAAARGPRGRPRAAAGPAHTGNFVAAAENWPRISPAFGVSGRGPGRERGMSYETGGVHGPRGGLRACRLHAPCDAQDTR
jgi:hypothetical protein